MTTNVGIIDRIIRFVLMLVFFVVGSLYVDGWARIALYAMALAMTITFTTGYCFLYQVIGINKNVNNKKKR
ncbi:MAG: hypothetical protein ACD_5C00096G0003 [uncultured bacterium]|nr:MAG: hypothetical protein ACD_5C00096G0003 [uncultured bacterium]